MAQVGDATNEHGRPAQPGPEPRRINVAVSPETVRALELIIEREGVSLTEAVRRLTGYGEFLYRAIKEDGTDLLLRTPDSARGITPPPCAFRGLNVDPDTPKPHSAG